MKKVRILKEHLQIKKGNFNVFEKDLRGEIEKVAKFLGKSLTENELTQLKEHLKVDNFAKNESVNFEIGNKFGFFNENCRFIRKDRNVSLSCFCLFLCFHITILLLI